MKKLLSIALVVALAAACNESADKTTGGKVNEPSAQLSQNGLSLSFENNPELQYENLRVYPIHADPATVAANAMLASLKTTREAMQAKGFRITELKQFGRDGGAQVNALTVANKTEEPVLLLAGDVVTGGNQDRVIADDQVIAAKSIKNVDVFCVERGRWTYYDENAPASDKKVAAFRGYYNVASTEVRRAIHRTGNQQDVWDAVAKVTQANEAESGTGTYAALEKATEQKAKRDAFLAFFDGKFSDDKSVTGMIVVCGDRVLGVDIFGHPDIFKRQLPSLMHGYAADAAMNDGNVSVQPETIRREFEKVAPLFAEAEKSTDKVGKFSWQGKTVHLYSK